MLITQAIKNAHGPTHTKFSLEVVDIFEVERKGEKQQYYPFKILNNKSNYNSYKISETYFFLNFELN